MKGLLASGTVLLVIDQWTKRAVQLLRSRRLVSGIPFLQIRHVVNFNRIYRSRYARAILVFAWMLALISAAILHRTGLWFQGRISQIGLGLAFGGAMGNLLDVVRRHSVVDFIDLRWWPVFNVADVGIVGGLFLAFWR